MLDIQFEQEVAWQKSCARITAQGQVIQGNIPEMPKQRRWKNWRTAFNQAKDAYMKLYRENRTGRETACFAKLYIWQ